MNFTASSNILLDNSNSLTTSSLDEDSKRVFTCNRNEMSTRDKTHRGIKKKNLFALPLFVNIYALLLYYDRH